MKTAIRRVLPLLLALALVACGGSPEESMQSAKEALAQGDYDSAVVDLKNVLKEQPDNADARLLLGDVSVLLGDVTTARTQLDRARELGMDPERLQPVLARALLGLGDYQAVLDEIQPDAAADSPGIQAALLTARGDAQLSLGNPDAARQAYQRAHELDSESVMALTGLANLALRQGRVADAASQVEKAAEIAPDHAQVALVRARIAFSHRNLDEAIARYRKAIDGPGSEILPIDRFHARTRLAEAYIQQNKLDAADQVVKAMRQQSGDHPMANYLAGQLAYQRGDYNEAATRLQETLSAAPDSLQAKALLGVIKARQEQYAQAEAYLSEVLAANPGNTRIRLLLARVLREGGNGDRASQVLSEGVRLSRDDPEALAALGNEAALGGDLEGLMNALSRGDPMGAGQLQVNLGEALMQGGKSEGALSVLSDADAGDESDELRRRRLLITAAMRAGDQERARDETESLLESYPDNAAVQSIAGGVSMALNQYDKAQKHLERARRLAPDSPGPGIQLAMLSLARDRPAEAESHLRQVLNRHPDSTAAMMVMARAAEAAGNRDKAVEWLERARGTSPDALRPRILLARYYVARGDSDKAHTIVEELVKAAPERADMLALRGLVEYASGDVEKAIATLTRASEMDTQAANIRFALARAQFAGKHFAEAARTLERLRRTNRDFLPAGYLLGLAQYEAGNHDAALETAAELAGQSNGEAMGAMLEGELRARMDDPDSATEAFARAAAAGSREAVRRAVSMAERAGTENPVEALERWVDEHPDDADARVSLANWYAGKDRYQEAIPHYEAVLDRGGRDNPGVLNNLAWAYQQVGDQRALETARKAHELAPQAAPVLDTLGWIETLEGDPKRGADILAEAVDKAPEAGEIRYHYAEALARAGRKDDARAQIGQALDNGGDFPHRDEAEQLADRLE